MPRHPRRRRPHSALDGDAIAASEFAGDPIVAKLSSAPGNGAAVGGVKVATEHAVVRRVPERHGEDVYKIYAESFKGPEHLAEVQAEAKRIVDAALTSAWTCAVRRGNASEAHDARLSSGTAGPSSIPRVSS